jgi:MFS family permease
MIAFASTSLTQFLFLGGMGYLLITMGASPTFAAVLAVCGKRRRAVAIACIFFSANLLGLGLGPLTTGSLSDLFAATHGKDGLRYALIIVSAVLVPTAWCFFRAGYAMAPISEDDD